MKITQDYIYFDEDFYPFWEYLNLNEDCNTSEVQNAFDNLSIKEQENPFVIFAWKLLKDPYFSDVYKKYRSIEFTYKSGFFIDQYTDNNELFFDLNFLTTPFYKLQQNINNVSTNDKPYIVLLTCGGFSPIHKMHLEKMELSRNILQEEGYTVIGGYISPSHDNYVSQKYNGNAAMNIEKRIYMVEKTVSNSDWLYVDRWEGLFNSKSINFTDVIMRLEQYLNLHLITDSKIKVCFAFGSDNADFLNAFENKNYAVCVERSGYNVQFKEYQNKYKLNSNLFFVTNNDQILTSSSLIREGNLDLIPDTINETYNKFKMQVSETSNLDVYAIRDDLSLVTEKIVFNDKIYSNFSRIIKKYFDNNITLLRINASYQIRQAHKLVDGVNSISLDVHFKGTYNIGISRLFDLSSGQINANKLTERPGSLDLNSQISKIPSGEYTLVEDDIGSGTTMKKLMSILPDSVVIKEKIILSHINESNNFYDIIDLRDFVIGMDHGGLVTTLPNGEITRAPYMLPYVSPSSRAKISPGNELNFSLDLWNFNHKIFSDLNLTLSDLDINFIKLMKYVGFNESTSVIDIINYHIEKLQRL